MRRTAPITRSRSGSGWRDEAEKTGQAHRAGTESRRAREGAAEDARAQGSSIGEAVPSAGQAPSVLGGDRKSTRLNSSHSSISYAVFCLKKKKRRFRTTELERDSQ